MKTPKRKKLNDCYTALQHMKNNTRPTRKTKDGSIPTHSVVPVPDVPETTVLKNCLKWLREHRIMCNRHDCGVRQTPSGLIQFGIKDAGDIIGILPNGVHLEIECKRGRGGRLSAGQQDRMRDIRATNGAYLVVHGVLELEYYMGGLV
jgi:hypothetical protein